VLYHFNNHKRNKAKVTTTATLFILATIVVAGAITSAVIAPLTSPQSASAQTSVDTGADFVVQPKAPMAVSEDGNNVYLVWWTNKSENWEVMFRASNDGGATFGDRINLSNSTDTESQNAEIVAAGNNVYISWWETSPITGSSESVLRVSTDRGQTFAPVVMVGTNGTITTIDNSTETNNTAAGGEGEGE
jgi:hypothetical protein